VTATRRLRKLLFPAAAPFHSIDRPPAAGRIGTAPSSSPSVPPGKPRKGGKRKEKKKVVGVSGTSQLVSSSSLMIDLPTPT
jgi:hypothetical protein